MTEIIENVNWIAVIVGAVASFMLGWLWYSEKLFGVKWAEGAKVKFENSDAMPMTALIAQALATFLLSWIIGLTAAANALLLATLIVFTIVMFMIAGGMFSQKSSYTITVEASFVVVMAAIMILCHGLI